MKTKNVLMVGIAVCLTLVLLTSPVLANEDDYVLDIYGNANEDDTIDMRDLTYVKLIFFGKKPETELADAKYDGKINPLDFIQIKLIIVGKEKELTLIDSADRTVTAKKPVERAVLAGGTSAYFAEAIQILGSEDKIVGVSDYIKRDEIYIPELSKLPSVGGYPPDYEAILSLNPDIVIIGPAYGTKTAQHAEKLPGIVVLGFNLYKSETSIEELVKLGYIFGKENRVEHYIEDFHDKYIGLITARTEGLSEEEKPKVWVNRRDNKAYCGKSAAQQFVDMCGGRNIFADIPEGTVEIDPEEVIRRDPDIIIKYLLTKDAGGSGYNTDDTSQIKALWEDMVNRPELANVNAVKNERVYIMNSGLPYGADYPIAMIYWAKWFHPNLFEDLDPQASHQEFIDEFLSIDFNVYEHGVFVYPPLED